MSLVLMDDVRLAHNATNYRKLITDLRLTQAYGAAGRIELPDGRIRYYGLINPASNTGEMVGRRLVREWNPSTGKMRTWHETLDAQGGIRIVRPAPQLTAGQKVHYLFDQKGNYLGSF